MCGAGAECRAANHVAECRCIPPLQGDPKVACTQGLKLCYYIVETGINAKKNNRTFDAPFYILLYIYFCQFIKSMMIQLINLLFYLTAGPAPECTTDSECGAAEACVNLRCVSACAGACGSGALCTAVDHRAACRCPPGTAGDPARLCYTREYLSNFQITKKNLFI